MVQLPFKGCQLGQEVSIVSTTANIYCIADLLLPWRRVNNFSRDVSDATAYTVLLNQLKPDQCSKSPLQTPDVNQRAEQVS